MSQEVNITVTGNSVRVKSPYNVLFIKGAKVLGGRWNAPAWVFDAREEDEVRDLCMEVYGQNGIDEPDLVTVERTYQKDITAARRAIRWHGRDLVFARDRDSGAKVCDGVVLLEGRISSGGSRANWETQMEAGTKLRIHDVPRHVAEKVEHAVIVGEEEVDRAAILMAEITALEQRKAELETELAELLEEV